MRSVHVVMRYGLRIMFLLCFVPWGVCMPMSTSPYVICEVLTEWPGGRQDLMTPWDYATPTGNGMMRHVIQDDVLSSSCCCDDDVWYRYYVAFVIVCPAVCHRCKLICRFSACVSCSLVCAPARSKAGLFWHRAQPVAEHAHPSHKQTARDNDNNNNNTNNNKEKRK